MNRAEHVLEGVGHAVVTGGSSGIGASFIKSILDANADLILCNLSRSKPAGFEEDSRLVHHGCDLSRPEGRASAAVFAEQFVNSGVKLGKVLIINNAGFGDYGAFAERPIDLHLEMIGLNVLAPVELTGRLLPVLRARGGIVINVASIAAWQSVPTLAVYAATKAFLLNWSLALSEELREEPVRVLAVCPGPVPTGFSRRAGFDEREVNHFVDLGPDKVVAETFRTLDRGRSLFVPGWMNRIITALVMHLPRNWACRMAGRVISRSRLPKA